MKWKMDDTFDKQKLEEDPSDSRTDVLYRVLRFHAKNILHVKFIKMNF